MPGVPYLSPSKSLVGRRTEYAAMISHRRDGRVRKISQRKAMTLPDASPNTLRPSEEILAQAAEILKARRVRNDSPAWDMDDNEFGDSHHCDSSFGESGLDGGVDSQENMDLDNDEDEDNFESDDEILETTSAQNMADLVDEMVGRKNILAQLRLDARVLKERRTYKEKQKTLRINWDIFVKAVTGDVALKPRKGVPLCTCKKTLVKLPAISFHGNVALLLIVDFSRLLFTDIRDL
jgi:hypothetical protein